MRKTSKHSTKFVLKEDKFNLKTIIYFFILIDLSLIPFGVWEALFYITIYQATIIVSLMVGLRGQARYKQAMGELRSIARDKSLSIEAREHMLVMGVQHYFLELGFIYDDRLKKYGLNYFKKKNNLPTKEVTKKTKNKEVKKRMIWDEVVWKQFGYMLVGVWGFLGVALFEMLISFWVLTPFWVFTITGIWYCVDVFIFFYIHYAFNIEPITTTGTIDINGYIPSDTINTTT